MQDVELMSVIILSDVGSGSAKPHEKKHNSKLTVSSTNTQSNTWGSTTLGQCAIIMEFVWIIKELFNYSSFLHMIMKRELLILKNS